MTSQTQNPLSQIETREWYDWRWQQKNALRKASDIGKYFPNFPAGEIVAIGEYEQTRRWGITPYTLSLMAKNCAGNPTFVDPLVKQFFPVIGFSLDDAIDSYHDNHGEINWEIPSEMPTRILHHKYPHKAILRTINTCLGYCSSCFEVARVEDKTKVCQRTGYDWQKSMEYIESHPEIKEVILSGGDPLLLSNESLENKLRNVSSINNVRAIRIHTRALTFNPFRIDEMFSRMVAQYPKVGAFGFHFAHPNEITEQVKYAVGRLDEESTRHERWVSTIKYAMIPLLKGINDDKDTLEELFMGLYEKGIKPYYLIHCFPGIQGAGQFRTSVKKGVELMNSLKRRISNVAMPEYIIPHVSGKHTVPLEPDGTPEFQYTNTIDGNFIVRFRNWKGNWETYLDGRDE